MKHRGSQIFTLFLLIIFAFASGGHTLYSHFCSMENEKHLAYIETDCKTAVEKTCCAEKQEENPCCTDTVEFDTQDQFLSKFDDIQLTTIAIATPIVKFAPIVITSKKSLFATKQFARPPNIKTCIRFQQFLL